MNSMFIQRLLNIWVRRAALYPFRTAKAATNGNHRLSKIETTSKVSLKLTSRINLGRRCASTPRAFDFGHSPQAPPSPPPPPVPHSLERVKELDSAQCWRAPIKLVIDLIPFFSFAASALTVCSRVRSIGEPENDFSVNRNKAIL